MELAFLFAFSIVVAILFNYATPKFASTRFGQRFVGSYTRVTLGTAVVFFLAIYLSALLFSAVSHEPRLPSASNPTG